MCSLRYLSRPMRSELFTVRGRYKTRDIAMTVRSRPVRKSRRTDFGCFKIARGVIKNKQKSRSQKPV